LRDRMSSYKVPKHVLFFSDGEIPMTGSETKVRDAELLNLVEARLNGAHT
jgi:fatty-acyl-CoA synthase